MAYGLPDNLWIGLLVMAVIILALLWKDKISKSSGGSGGTETTPDGPSFQSIEHKPVNPDPGEEINFKAEYTANASISTYWFKVDGRKRDTTNTGGSLKTGPLTFEEGSYRYKAYVKDKNGKESSIGSSFSVNSGKTLEGPKLKMEEEWGEDVVELVAKAKTRSADSISLTKITVEGVGQSEERGPEARIELPAEPGRTYSYTAETLDSNDLDAEVEGELKIPRNPSPLAVTANYDIVNEVEGNVRIWAEVTEYSHEIDKTRIQFRPEGAGDDAWAWQEEEGAIRAEIPDEERENLSDGVYEVKASARDVENNRATDTTKFSLGEGGGGGSRDDFPELVRIINQNTNNNLGDLGGFRGDEEVMAILEQILEQVDASTGDGETGRVGMDAYQLLFALNALGVDLDSSDNQQIVAELQRIREEMGTGGMSGTELENALRTVLHDVFGQDLQSVIEGLDLGGGFDEEAIVQALEDRDIDLTAVTDRLDNIEQAVQQIEAQGGDMSEVEQKLDDIESAVQELQVDDQIFQDLTGEIEALRNEGIQVNVDMNDPLIIKLVEDIQHSGNPQRERRRILQSIRREGMVTRRLLIQLLEDDTDPDESGGEGNKNEEEDNGGMPNADKVEYKIAQDTKKEIEELEEAFKDLESLEEGQREELQITQHIEEDVEQLIKLLKDVRKHEHKVEQLLNNEITKGEWQKVGKHEDKIMSDLEEARAYLQDFMESVANIEDHYKDNDQVLSQLDDLKDALVNQQEELMSLEDKLEDTMDEMSSYRAESKASQNYS